MDIKGPIVGLLLALVVTIGACGDGGHDTESEPDSGAAVAWWSDWRVRLEEVCLDASLDADSSPDRDLRLLAARRVVAGKDLALAAASLPVRVASAVATAPVAAPTQAESEGVDERGWWYLSCYTAEEGYGYPNLTRMETIPRPGVAAAEYQLLGKTACIRRTGACYSLEDTGSGVGPRHLDVWFETNAECFAWLAAVGSWAEVEVIGMDQ